MFYEIILEFFLDILDLREILDLLFALIRYFRLNSLLFSKIYFYFDVSSKMQWTRVKSIESLYSRSTRYKRDSKFRDSRLSLCSHISFNLATCSVTSYFSVSSFYVNTCFGIKPWRDKILSTPLFHLRDESFHIFTGTLLIELSPCSD